jgi:hypothetical protein
MAGGQQTYGVGGLSIAGLIEHLGREAERLHRAPGAALSSARLSAPSKPQGIRYGQLYAPHVDDLVELRRQQAQFARTKREIDRQNMWLWAPALAPIAAPFLVEGGATALVGRARQANIPEGPLNLLDHEPWWREAEKTARALREARDGAIRARARTRFARTNGISASEMEAKVHHSDPLEWAHLKPNADPNRTANLWGLREEHHLIANKEWIAFKKSLQGRTPSQVELMAAKLRIDRLVAPYIRRAGVSRWRTPEAGMPPKKGGPR